MENPRRSRPGAALAVMFTLAGAATLQPRSPDVHSAHRDDVMTIVEAALDAAPPSRASDAFRARRTDDATSASSGAEIALGPARVILLEARSVPATPERGARVQRDVLPSTHRVIAVAAGVTEELLVLASERAPHAFAWRVDAPATTHVEMRGDRLALLDTTNALLAEAAAPWAIDARGEIVHTALSWDAPTRTMRLDVLAPHPPGTRGATYPLVVDPTYESYAWSLAPGLQARSGMGAAYDSARAEWVMFGGWAQGSGNLADTWVYAAGAWLPRNPARSPSARQRFAMGYDAARARVVLFGGQTDAGAPLADTWTWDGTNWTEQAPATSPTPRFASALAYDAARSTTILFGGATMGAALADTWEWNGTTWLLRAPAAAPSARQEHAVVYDPQRQRIVLFGGASDVPAQTPLGDTWSWNGTTWAAAAASGPSPRSRMNLAFDPTRQRVVLFGGLQLGAGTTRYGDTWLWDGAVWTAATPATSPSARSTGVFGYIPGEGRSVYFGGYDSAGSRGDTWGWDGSTWTQVSDGVGPVGRTGGAAAFDAMRGNLVYFGGASNTVTFAETWTWDGSLWQRRIITPRPTPRSSPTMVYDPTRGEVVLFGGYTPPSTRQNDTWTWNGSAWTQKAPTRSPSARSRAAMAFCSACATGGQVVLFGGNSGTAFLGDTWTWDGTNWTNAAPAVAPPVRSDAAMAGDASRGNVVLFGGANGAVLGDTWTWNGTSWAQVTAPVHPSARFKHAMAFDTTRAATVLFGGAELTGFPTSDTWLWDGATWSAASVLAAPAARSGMALAFDGARNRMLLHGGSNSVYVAGAPEGQYFEETWFGSFNGSACTSDASCPGAFCVDGVCCAATSCSTCQTCNGTSPGRCTAVLSADDLDTCSGANGRSCDATGACKLALGQTSTRASDCASAFVADGLCCDSACDTPCRACRDTLKASAVESGRCDAARGGTDPHDRCDATDATTCGYDGMCDGRGACRVWAAGAACGSAACVDGRATGAVCDGFGTCTTSATGIVCGAYACLSAAGCATTCNPAAAAGTTTCAALHHCDQGACVPDVDAACDGDHIVASPRGTSRDCSPYRCAGATCLTSCAKKTDCAGETDCTPGGVCVAFQDTPTADGGGCATSSAPAFSSFAWMPLVAAAALRRRRRLGADSTPELVDCSKQVDSASKDGSLVWVSPYRRRTCSRVLRSRWRGVGSDSMHPNSRRACRRSRP